MKNSFFFRSSLQTLALLFVALLSNLQSNAQITSYLGADVYGTATGSETFGATLTLGLNYFASGYDNNSTGTITKITASTGTWVWTKSFYGPNGEITAISDIQESHSGNLIVVGLSRPGPVMTNMQLFVMEVNINTGAILQSKIITRSGNNRFLVQRIVKTQSPTCPSCSGSYILSSWRSDGGSSDDIFMAKLDYALNLSWANEYGAAGDDDQPMGLISTPGGGAVVGGMTSQGGFKGFLMEVDCNGAVVVNNSYRGPTGSNFIFNNLMRANDGTNNIICNARYQAPTGSGWSRGGVEKINGSTYAPIWSKIYQSPNPEEVDFGGLGQIAGTATSSTIYTSYFAQDPSSGLFKHRVFSIANASGVFGASRDLGTFPAINTSRITNNGLRVVVSTAYPNGPIGSTDAYLAVLNNLLNTCGTTTPRAAVSLTLTKAALTFPVVNVMPLLTATNYCSPTSLTYTQDIACGFSNKPGAAIERNAKETDPLLNFNPTADVVGWAAAQQAIRDRNLPETDTETAELQDFQIFPNPANETFEILLSGTPDQEYQVQVFDVMGKLVKTYAAESEEQTTLDISDLPKGIYTVKVGNAAAQKLTKM